MEKLDLSKLKMASSSIGERIMTGGAQMGRTISSKMKEILQTPTPESKIVDEATAETMTEPNWGLNLRICAMISREEYDGAEIVRAIKKKLVPGKNPLVHSLSLDLLETCTSNCEKVFSEVASEKVLDDMVKLIDDSRTEHGNRARAMQLISAWGESEDLNYLPVFRQTHMYMKSRGIPQVQEQTMPPMQRNLESYIDQQPLTPHDSYPIPNTGVQNEEDGPFMVYDLHSVEEKKEYLVVARNSLDILTSILNSETDPKSLKDELTMSMLEKCKQSLPVLQRIIQTTADDEVMLFDALNLHDELQLVISRHEELSRNTEELSGNSNNTEEATLQLENSKTEELSNMTGATPTVQSEIHGKTEMADLPKVSSAESNKASHAEESAVKESVLYH